jgi:TonB family protein
VKDIVFVGVDPAVQEQIRNALPIHPGDTINPQAYVAAVNALQRIDEHLMLATMSIRKADGGAPQANLQIRVRPDTNLPLPPAPPLVSSDGKPSPLRVGGNVQSYNLVNKVTPAYPPLAKQARVQGTVRLDATIGTDGKVKDLVAKDGDPLLIPAAMEAVWQWVYKPTLLNGQPVEVQTTIDINFTLSQ